MVFLNEFNRDTQGEPPNWREPLKYLILCTSWIVRAGSYQNCIVKQYTEDLLRGSQQNALTLALVKQHPGGRALTTPIFQPVSSVSSEVDAIMLQ